MPFTVSCCKATCRKSDAVQPPDADADAAGYVTAAAADSPESCREYRRGSADLAEFSLNMRDNSTEVAGICPYASDAANGTGCSACCATKQQVVQCRLHESNKGLGSDLLRLAVF